MNYRSTRTTPEQIAATSAAITCDTCWDTKHTTEACPRKRIASDLQTGPKLASEKQIAFITRLVDERDLDAKGFDGDQVETLLDFGGGKAITSREASHLIDGLLRAPWKSQPTPEATGPVEGLDLSSLPSGHYAVPGGDTRLKVRIDKPAKGNWAGFIFVKDGAEYGQERRYGMQKPGQAYRGDIEDALRAIVADPKAAAARYGELTGQCAICNRPLEDETSVERGIGPICWGRVGW
jgi:hypothetical protein